MKEDIVSSKHNISDAHDPSLPKSPLSPPTPAASSVGASSPAPPANDGSLLQCTTLNGLSNLSCRPWERGDLLRRLSTFKLTGKAKVAGSLACAKRGWVNSDVDKIECEICGATLDFTSSESSINFVKNFLNSLIEDTRSLVLGEFYSLPVVSSSAVEQIRLTHGPQIDRFLAQLQIQAAGDMGYRAESASAIGYSGEQTLHSYSYAEKLISLCGWEARWLRNVLDCEEQSAESAKNDYSSDPAKGSAQYPMPSRREFSASSRKDTGGIEVMGSEFNCESTSPLLDCSLCGTTVRVWDFLTVPRPVHLAPCSAVALQMSKKVTSTQGVSAASGINEWIAADGVEKECTDGHDEATTPEKRQLASNKSLYENLKVIDGLSCSQVNINLASDQVPGPSEGKFLMLGKPSGSEVGDRAASYESQGPNARKRQLDDGGSTVDRPHMPWQQANSAEGIIVDNEVTGGQQYSAGPSKRARDPSCLDKIQLSCRRDSFGAVPSHSLDTQIEADASTGNRFDPDGDNVVGIPSTRESTHASSIIAMDTIYHSSDDESMESVENFPLDVNDISFNSAGLNETSELNSSYQGACSQPVLERAGADAVVSSSNACGEVLNTDTLTAPALDGPSFGISGGSVGMGASHEAEIHGTDISVHRGDSLGDVEPEGEVIEHQGQAGEYVPHGQIGDFVPEEMSQEDPQGDSQAVVSQSTARTDSGSKIVSTKVESVESGEKTCSSMRMLGNENGAHPSLSCNAIVCSAYEASKEEVTQTGKASLIDDSAYIESGCLVADDMGAPYGDKINGGVEFDPIKQHDEYCPWVNRDVAAAGCVGPSSLSGVDAVALCGWQLTLDALDSFLSLGIVPVQTVESESAASLCKGDRLAPSQKLLASNSFVRSRGKN
ncbi:uncharacterized protein LOC129315686 isoform X2 [Prosopis cineraria]|uniref:uncharacterized protein LOC129315686 isoform X2 n=1 Tax=Prosopis cineraria TaxID=364024 RepID=UPI0024105516|nr:uncharacterized protein LOC129315686 isoform X2 [Prosopis cineraria]